MKRPMDVIRYPHLTEKSVSMVEEENKLVFIVQDSANKNEVKWAVEEEFGVGVVKVNTLNTMKGNKKAIVQLSGDDNAIDIATRLGML
ncbi:MAG: 50S ribosomal protein L23 [Candidatus Aenigmatarchaeota archaeon]